VVFRHYSCGRGEQKVLRRMERRALPAIEFQPTKRESDMAAPYRLPKTLLGVRVPKKLRKSKLIDWLLNDPIGRNLMADALVAAAGAVAAALTRNPPKPVKRGVREAAEAGRELTHGAGDKLASAAEIFGSALTGAAGHLFPEEDGVDTKRKKKKKKGRNETKGKGEGAHFSRH
jgi:hypothetical protein